MTGQPTPVGAAVPPRAPKRPQTYPVGPYVGLVSRGIAFAVDASIISLVATLVGLGVSLVSNILHLPHSHKDLVAGLGTAAFVLWTIAYFVVFWSTTGQTPGNRVMGIRVVTPDGRHLKPRRALIRCGAVVIAVIPFFWGFFFVLIDSKRRGIHDRLAGTVVTDAPDLSFAEQRRLQKRLVSTLPAVVLRRPSNGAAIVDANVVAGEVLARSPDPGDDQTPTHVDASD